MDFSSSVITPVILCGGFGPDSTNEADRPKPFRKRSGNLSRFQQTLLRLSDSGQFNAPLIVADKTHHSLIEFELEMIGAAPSALVLEPLPRGSAAAVTLAALVAGACDFKGSLLVIPCDQLVLDPSALMSAIEEGASAAQHGALLTFGRKAKPGDEGHALLQKGEPLSDGGAAANVFRLGRFVPKNVEKDVEALASEAEYFRNSGMYLLPMTSLLQELCAHAPDVLTSCQQALIHGKTEGNLLTPSEDGLTACPSMSIEAALLEHTARGAVFPTTALWVEDGPRPYLPREFAQPQPKPAVQEQTAAKPSVLERIDAVQQVLALPDASQPEFDFTAESEAKDVPQRQEAAERPPENVVLKDVSNVHVQSNGPLTVVAGLGDVIVINVGEAVVVTSRSHVSELLDEQVQRHAEMLEGGDSAGVLPEAALALLRLASIGHEAEAPHEAARAADEAFDPSNDAANKPEGDLLFCDEEREEPPLLLHADMDSAA